MFTLMEKINHILELDLSKPLGRRAQAALLAVLLVVVGGQMTAYAVESSQKDCVGDYEDAIATYFNELQTELENIRNNYSWYNPMRNIMVSAAGAEYYASAESAFFQMLACSALPKFT